MSNDTRHRKHDRAVRRQSAGDFPLFQDLGFLYGDIPYSNLLQKLDDFVRFEKLTSSDISEILDLGLEQFKQKNNNEN